MEEAAYFSVPGAHLYTVLHTAANPVARVLLVGPFASERHNSYIPWVRWARYLAARRIEVLRYDYRGIGESTGVFEEMTFELWNEDVRLLAGWLADRVPRLPLLLHGLEMGGLFAGNAFQAGVGDALLLWSAPAGANQALRSTLMRWVGLEQLLSYSQERKSTSDYIRQLEGGTVIDVEGYPWSPGFWRGSFDFCLPASMDNGENATSIYERPVRTVKLGKEAAPLVKGGSVAYDELKDFGWLFSANSDWIATSLAISKESEHGRGD